jgi:cysteine desulfurase/selenocysteine lyase
VNPVARLIADAQNVGAITVIDGAQAALHIRPDVRALNCDFYAVSGHKMYAPTGIGALYGKLEWLERIPPWQGGGEMIRQVSFEKTEYNDVPAKFEAGTPNIAGAVGLGAAVRYLDSLGMEAIAAWEHHLLRLGTERLETIDGLRIIGTAAEKASVISFVLDGVHPHDLGTVIDHYGVAIRTGHHCAMPVMQFFGVPATARVSIGLYNTEEEMEILANAIEESRKMFN